MICDKLRKLINLGVTTLLFEEMTLHPKNIPPLTFD